MTFPSSATLNAPSTRTLLPRRLMVDILALAISHGLLLLAALRLLWRPDLDDESAQAKAGKAPRRVGSAMRVNRDAEPGQADEAGDD